MLVKYEYKLNIKKKTTLDSLRWLTTFIQKLTLTPFTLKTIHFSANMLIELWYEILWITILIITIF